MSKREMGVGEALWLLVVTFGGAFALALLHAVVVRDLWAWFVAPTWGLAIPSLAATYGSLLLVSVIRWKPAPKDDAEGSSWKRVLMMLFGRAVGSGVAWLIGRAVWALSHG